MLVKPEPIQNVVTGVSKCCGCLANYDPLCRRDYYFICSWCGDGCELMPSGSFNDDMIHRTGLPADVMGLIHDLCYHVESRGVAGYIKRAQRILSVDGCGSPVRGVSSPKSNSSAASLTSEIERLTKIQD